MKNINNLINALIERNRLIKEFYVRVGIREEDIYWNNSIQTTTGDYNLSDLNSAIEFARKLIWK